MKATADMAASRTFRPVETEAQQAPRTNAERANHWRDVINDFNRSGVSAERYSAETGVSYCQLLYWSRKLVTSASPQAAGSFKELGILEPRSEYCLKLSNNRELIIPSGSNAGEVAALADALEARA